MNGTDDAPDAALLRRLYLEEGRSLRAIAQQFGWSYRAARTRVRAAGVRLRRRGRRPVPVTVTPDERAILQRFLAAAGARRVAQALHIDADALHALLAPAPSDRAALAAALRTSGMAAHAVAALLGCSPRTVARLVRRVQLAADHCAADSHAAWDVAQ